VVGGLLEDVLNGKLENCVYFSLVWVWGMGSINIIWWFVTIEKCLGRPVEFTENEIGGI
jgi:hypothetical protein